MYPSTALYSVQISHLSKVASLHCLYSTFCLHWPLLCMKCPFVLPKIARTRCSTFCLHCSEPKFHMTDRLGDSFTTLITIPCGIPICLIQNYIPSFIIPVHLIPVYLVHDQKSTYFDPRSAVGYYPSDPKLHSYVGLHTDRAMEKLPLVPEKSGKGCPGTAVHGIIGLHCETLILWTVECFVRVVFVCLI